MTSGALFLEATREAGSAKHLVGFVKPDRLNEPFQPFVGSLVRFFA